MTFEEFWEQSGWYRKGEEVGGTSEYNLAVAAWNAGQQSNRRELEQRGQAIADAMGRYRGTAPLIEGVTRLARNYGQALDDLFATPIWICSHCDKMKAGDDGLTSWRWTGEIWEHHCADLRGNVGHFPGEKLTAERYAESAAK